MAPRPPRFNTALDLDFHRLASQREVSQIHSELAITPARWLALNVYESFTPQNFTLNQFSTGLRCATASVDVALRQYLPAAGHRRIWSGSHRSGE